MAKAKYIQGWFQESIRHKNAKILGKAGPPYKTKGKQPKVQFRKKENFGMFGNLLSGFDNMLTGKIEKDKEQKDKGGAFDDLLGGFDDILTGEKKEAKKDKEEEEFEKEYGFNDILEGDGKVENYLPESVEEEGYPEEFNEPEEEEELEREPEEDGTEMAQAVGGTIQTGIAVEKKVAEKVGPVIAKAEKKAAKYIKEKQFEAKVKKEQKEVEEEAAGKEPPEQHIYEKKQGVLGGLFKKKEPVYTVAAPKEKKEEKKEGIMG